MCEGRSPVIIDNTNIHAWEMKPYVETALETGYNVCFYEPETSWKCDPIELERRNTHGVPRDKIAKMLECFEAPMTVDIVLNSCKPPHKSPDRPPRQQDPSQLALLYQRCPSSGCPRTRDTFPARASRPERRGGKSTRVFSRGTRQRGAVFGSPRDKRGYLFSFRRERVAERRTPQC
uniref:NEDD4-binding protein 2-like 1 n=1 Tax=Denticeps clupeoides TaxID=299321 RepID=A0AAY4CZE0_9TELE